MRILQLNLIAFGPFTDCRLDLAAGQEGLHVVYGPNEAGKSSALRAISDFFFGIHVRHERQLHSSLSKITNWGSHSTQRRQRLGVHSSKRKPKHAP